MNPINYSIDVVNPLQEAAKGYAAGAAIRNDRQAQENILRERQAAQQMQADLNVLANNRDAKAQDYAAIMVKYPSISEDIKRGFETMDTGQKNDAVKKVSQIYTAVKTGNIDVAKDLLQRRISAAENSGNAESAATSKVILNSLKMNPRAAETTLGIALSAITGAEEFAKTLETLQGVNRADELQPLNIDAKKADIAGTQASTQKTLGDDARAEGLQPGKIAQQGATLESTEAGTAATIGGEQRAEQMQPYKLKQALAGIGLTKAQTNSAYMSARKAQADINKIQQEAQRMSDGGIIEPEKMFDTETKLRNEYVKNTADFAKTQDAFRKIEVAQDNPAGHMSLVFSYMKMLDPASTVREGEAASVRNAGGVPTRVMNAYNQAVNGKGINPEQIAEFKGQAEKLLEAASVRESEVRKGITNVADNYRLNKENIFYTEAPRKTDRTIDDLLNEYGPK